MTFSRLYEFSRDLREYPVRLEGVLDKKAAEFATQDELHYVPVELDINISFGHIKQYQQCVSPYDPDPRMVTEIRYFKDLNECWRRYVCCKELMHVFDHADEQVNCPDRFNQLLDELEAPLPSDKQSPIYQSETRTMWMALAVLCPKPVLEHFKPIWQAEKKSSYEVALELRIPEVLIKSVMSSNFEKALDVVAR